MSKIGICAGHYNGANRIPSQFATTAALKSYSEGTAMFNLAGLICSSYPQIFNARPEVGTAKPWFPNFTERAKRLAAQKCDYAFELHTNWSMKTSTTPNRGTFLVITSLCYEDGKSMAKRQAEEKALATKLWKPLADKLGLKFEIRTKKGGGNWDYYSFINFCKKRGIAHPMIIEHGYHMDYAEDVEGHSKLIADYYANVLAMVGAESGGGAQPATITHTVAKGESLSRIAADWRSKGVNVTWQQIAALNGIKFPYIIRPGQKLRIK